MNEAESHYRFLQLSLHAETAHHSNPNMWRRSTHYKKIIAMTWDAVPFILSDLQKYLRTGDHKDYPGWWVMDALPDITGIRFVVAPMGESGMVIQVKGFVAVDVDQVSRWWVNWGIVNGLIQDV